MKIRNLKVDMIFQSSLVKTELIFVFEFAVQFLNIPFEYSDIQCKGARAVYFHYSTVWLFFLELIFSQTMYCSVKRKSIILFVYTENNLLKRTCRLLKIINCSLLTNIFPIGLVSLLTMGSISLYS